MVSAGDTPALTIETVGEPLGSGRRFLRREDRPTFGGDPSWPNNTTPSELPAATPGGSGGGRRVTYTRWYRSGHVRIDLGAPWVVEMGPEGDITIHDWPPDEAHADGKKILIAY